MEGPSQRATADMTSLAPHPTGSNKGSCPTCGATVLRALLGRSADDEDRFRARGSILVEACPFGTGNIGLTGDLFDGSLTAAPISGVRSGFRLHKCPTPSFSGEGFSRKKQPTSEECPNISYRSFDAPRREAEGTSSPTRKRR